MSSQEVSASEAQDPQPVQAASTQTLIQRLAGYLVTERGFRPEFPPEAIVLAQASDLLLSRHVGQQLEIVCLVDGEHTPGKTFDLSVEETRNVARACFKYTQVGSVYKSQMPVTISIIETTLDPDIEHLFELKDGFVRSGWFDKRFLYHAVINPHTNDFRTSRASDRKFLGHVLTSRALTPDEIAQSVVAPVANIRPILTYALLAVLAAVFGLELLLNNGPTTEPLTPSVQTLVALGGTIRSLVLDQGEWYRLWTAMFLHVGLTHLLFNGFALFLAGSLLERTLGRLRFLALFLVGGICGSFASLFLNPANLVGVGASGAIMACFAALLVIAFHYPPGPIQSLFIGRSISVLIPSLLPFLNFHTGTTIDYAAHSGGAIGGALIGAGFLVTWPRNRALPAGRWASIVMIVIGAGGLLYGAATLGQQFSGQDEIARLLPSVAKSAEAPDLWKKAIQGNTAYIDTYPNDPRGHIAYGVYLLDRGQYAAAEAEARKALDQKVILEKVLNKVVSAQATTILALAENLQGRANEAIETAKPVCGIKTGFDAFLLQQAICPADKPSP